MSDMISLWVGSYCLRVRCWEGQGWHEEHEQEAAVGQRGCLHHWRVKTEGFVDLRRFDVVAFLTWTL